MATSNYVDVYVWRGKDREGYTTTSTEGIRHDLENRKNRVPNGLERCGHVSMGIFNGLQEVHISLWPPGLLPSLDQDIQGERGTLPDVIVRLHHLNLEKMIAAFNTVKPKVQNKTITWKIDASDSEDVTDPKNTQASCASFVWSFLKIGGLDPNDKTSNYSPFVNLRGPRDNDFYELTKCYLGRRFWGLFDGWWWTRKHFTPYSLVLRIGSAAEAFENDKSKTIEIMKSDRVAKEKIGAPLSTTTTTSVRLIAFGLGYVFKQDILAGLIAFPLLTNFGFREAHPSPSLSDFWSIASTSACALLGWTLSSIFKNPSVKA